MSNIKTEIIFDWQDAEFYDSDYWQEGMPLKYFINPDEKLKELFRGLEFKLVNATPNLYGYFDVEVTGPAEYVENMCEYCENPPGVIEYIEELMKSETKESYEKWYKV
jgi:hypothetical protein